MNIVRSLPPSVFNLQSTFIIEYLKECQDGNYKETLLYPHQVEAVLELRKYFDPQQNPYATGSNIALVVLPTGCGKTEVAVLASYALSATRVLVITPSVIISRQICKAYKECLLKFEIISPEDDQYFHPMVRLITKSSDIREGMNSTVMVVNAHKIGGQSSVKIEDIPADGLYDLVIVDEAHHYPADTWKLLVDHFGNSKRLFLTATPEHEGRPILIYLLVMR